MRPTGPVSSSSCRRATWPSGCGPPARASARSSPPLGAAPRWPRARKPARSTAAATSWSTRSTATSPWSRRTGPTRWATWSTARPRATSGPSWRPPRRPRSSQVDEVVPVGALDPEARRHPVHLRRPDRRGRAAAHRAGALMSDAPTAVEHATGPAVRDELAARRRRDIPAGSFVNLGIGQPTKIADYLPPDSGRHPAHRERHARHGPRPRTATRSTRTWSTRASSR